MRNAVPLLLLTALAGCQSATAPPPVVSNFEVAIDGGLISLDIQLTFKGPKKLTAVKLEIRLFTERDEQTIERNWGEWRSGETKTINVLSTGGPVQQIDLSGSAKRGIEQQLVNISTSWTFSYSKKD